MVLIRIIGAFQSLRKDITHICSLLHILDLHSILLICFLGAPHLGNICPLYDFQLQLITTLNRSKMRILRLLNLLFRINTITSTNLLTKVLHISNISWSFFRGHVAYLEMLL